MGRYLTPAQYLRADEGIPGTNNLAPETLALYVQRAESAIDAYLDIDPRLGGFDAHSTVWYQEGMSFETRKTRIPTFPVPVRQVLRYRIHISNANAGGTPLVANIQPSDCVINEFDGYIEIVPLQAITYSLTPVIAQLGLQPPLVNVDLEVGYFLPVFGEILINAGDDLTYRALRAYWATTYTQALHAQPFTLPPIPPIVYVNGSIAASNTYILDFVNGQITFLVAQDPTATITCDYTYTIPDQVRDATTAQTSYLLGQRILNQMGMQGVEQVRSGDQNVKRHLRQNQGSSALDSVEIHPLAMQLLQPFKHTPLA